MTTRPEFRIAPTDPAGADAQTAMAAYFAELDERFPGGFDAGDALRDALGAFSPPNGVFLLAHGHGPAEPDAFVAGCGGVQLLAPDTAEVKRMWVAPVARGHGLGRRLLEALEQQAAELGARRVLLDTNSTLVEAVAMYERAGYHTIERYNDNPYAEHFFAKALP